MDESLDAVSREQTYPWPIVEQFLKDRKSGSIGLDVGCGNGKYLGVNKDVFMVGSDRSDGLISCAKEFGHEVMVSDGLSLPHPNNRFVTVIHHFSTPERRTQAIEHILSKLKSGGEALIYVWALEQEKSRRGYKEGDPQDVLVPWVLQKKEPKKEKKTKKEKRAERERLAQEQANGGEEVQNENAEESKPEEKPEEPDTKFRYYHLYKKGELEENAEAAGGSIVYNGYERDNWYAVIRKS
ncbi:Ubiquinone/menaquinone biosynthesis methyltransferase [Wickerhamomyces ciferrii]|uniref:Ubiquinone/menaquinone biosynthesis methyltransferase n=1 Tax=Wickerhamomyces ciferrii (strain ATCC 14091 / BCRC 22168 / CBS 111 / JCM 3599 / NBRC 0793 / NRRL Y-1031 F-60-10) TaxID=1206466 RepID=K0KD55_WICCF|nr:Ubiquinone/menaquinone biosynthesis methyltransferase [Wickerhamomyces ciferrii]CCH40816.1 Ubiquinone/menaquinone biosynthesis methyltransferase [Wickerhamomyces ciferrii]